MTAFAAKEDLYLLHEGFEEGIPATWTQEYSSGQVSWVAEAAVDANYPNSVYAGNYRAILRNTSTSTLGYKTRLISPVINIKDVVNPILVFSRAQLQRTGDVDPLKVFYRTSESSAWVLLKTYEEKTRDWVLDTLDLVAQSETYQIAFEAADNFGWGVALDEIIVRPQPTCYTPSDVEFPRLTDVSVEFTWAASLDADSFRVVVATEYVTDQDLMNPEAVLVDTIAEDYIMTLDSVLTRDTKYYVYIQSFCSGEMSEWGGASFTTKNFVKLPYSEDFDMPYLSGTVNHVAYWTYGTSILNADGTMEYMPFVNQNVSESSWKNYSQSQTTCLVFTGARAISTDIPAGNYVYAATPQLLVDNVNSLQVSFWGTVYQSVGEEYASGLIVGVMTDPSDFSTFVAVDTVYNTQDRVYNKYFVSLASYKGEGKYVAFASNFKDKNNIFYLDDVVIEEANVPVPSEVIVSDVLAQQFTLNANLNGASAYNVVVANVEKDTKGKVILDPAQLKPENILVAKNNQTTLPLTLELPAGNDGKFVEVYVQGVNGTETSTWALPIKVLVPTLFKGENIFIDFEKETENGYIVADLNDFSSVTNSYYFPYTILTAPMDSTGTSPSYPWVYSSAGYGANGTKGQISLGKTLMINSDNSIRAKQTYGDYIVLPQTDTVQNIILAFWAKRYNADTDNAKVQIGVLTDPYDITTFEKVAEYTAGADYGRQVITFDKYTGKGKFICIQAVESPNWYKYSSTSGSSGSYTTYKTCYTRIDQISISSLGGCVEPVAIEATPAPTGIELVWNAMDMEQWQVGIFADEDKADTIAWATVDTAYFALDTLKPHTTYYYQISTLCADDTISSVLTPFTTACLAAEAVPYYESFEAYAGGSTSKEIPYCWTMPLYKYTYSGGGEASTSYYPYIYSTTSAGYTHDGKKILNFGSSSLDSVMYFALPKMDAKLDTLQMSFWIKGGLASYKDTLRLGIMTDPADKSTFVKTHDIIVNTNVMKEVIVNFANYAGADGHIALMKNKDKHYYYIDAIAVTPIADCEKVQNVSVSNAKVNGATASWAKSDATAYDVMVASKELSNEELASVTVADSTTIILLDRVTAASYAFTSDSLKVNTLYYVYVRGVCSETAKGDWSNVASFRTTCTPQDLANSAEDFSDKGTFECWTVGRREGTTAVPSRNTNGYLYMFNSTASEGAYAIMPPLDIEDMSKVQISFDAHGGTGAAYLRELVVGIISNASDLSTFEPMATLSLPQVSATTAATGYGFDEGWRYTISFADYEGDYNGDKGTQVMFLSQNAGVANYVYIDNIVFDTVSAFAAPTDVYATEVGHDYANVVWNNAGSKYQVIITDEKVADPTSVTAVVDTIVSTDSVVVTGLDYLTQYYMYVRTINGTDTSAWSNVRWFTTVCPPVFNLPYADDFDSYKSASTKSLPSCWMAYYNGTEGANSNYPSAYSSAKYGSSGNGLYVASAIKYGPSYGVLPAMDGDLSKTMLSFFYKSNAKTATQSSSGGPNRYMAIGIAEEVSTLDTLLATLTILDTVVCSDKDNFEYYSLTLDQYTGTGKHLVLIGFGGNDAKSTTSTSTGGLYIDDLKLEKAPTCFTPVALNVTSATASSLTVTWEQPNGKNTQWDVACVLADSALTESTPFITVDALQATITGLTNSTDYDVYVRANCGEGEVSAWSDVATGTTLCIVPVAEAAWNFDTYETTVENPRSTSASYRQEACWMFLNPAATSYSYFPYNQKNSYSSTSGTYSSKYALTDSCALRMYSTSTYQPAVAVLPEVDADLDSMQIRFMGRAVYESYNSTSGAFTKYYNTYATGSYARSIKVGVMTDPYDVNTFEELVDYQFTEVTAANCSTKVEGDYWEEVTVPLYGVKGKYIAFMSKYDASNYAYIDNVVVEKLTGCPSPTKLAVNEETLTYSHADFTWSSPMNSFNVKLSVGDSLVLQQSVDTSAFATDVLTSLTDYTFAVQAVGNDTISDWVEVAFSTPCAPVEETAAVWNFEDGLFQYGSSATYLIPDCWGAGYINTSTGEEGTSQSYIPYAIPNTSTYAYARSEDDATTERALRFYGYHSSSYDYVPYVILPETAFELDSMALHFWGRAAYFYQKNHSTAASRSKLYAANKNYSKTLVLGTVEGEDYSTFVAIDTITYPYNWTSNTNVYAYNDETGNNYWVEYTIPLAKYAGEGKQIAIMAPAHSATSYFFVDDLEFVQGDFCVAPSGLRANGITANSATLVWTVAGSDSVQLQVDKTGDFVDSLLVVNTAFSGTSYALDNLEAGTTYYARVKHFCSAEEESDYSFPITFTTLYDIRFVQDFSEARTYPTGWTRYAKDAEDLFAEGGAFGSPVSETATYAWKRSLADEVFSTTHLDVYVQGTSSYWIVTPTISLADYANDSLMLSFDLALNSSEGTKDLSGEDDMFIVAVSLDGGTTWKQEDAIIWNNTGTGQYVFNDITSKKGGEKCYLDFTKYAGKNINIAFCGGSTKSNATNYIHMDNVQLNTYNAIKYASSICRWNDYVDKYFDIDAYGLIVGTTNYTYFEPADEDGKDDYLYSLDLTVMCDTTVVLNHTLCEGEMYSNYGFNIEATKSGTYKQKLQGVNTCDSTVVLNLTVLPRIENVVETTICQGSYYEFNGVKYYTNMIHTDTLSSLVTGCDSIVTLRLSVTEALTGMDTVHLCPGTSVNFGKFGDITAAGKYTDTLTTALGCDSIVTLQVIAEETQKTFFRALICSDERYSDDAFRGLNQPGEYTSTQKTIWGCDSIITLHLVVADIENVAEDSIALAELPYVIDGVELLDKDTKEGVYVKTVNTSCGSIILTITVGNPSISSLQSVYTNTLAIAPNPVAVGTPVSILTNFAEAELCNATINVYDATGMLVQSQNATTNKQQTIDGIPTAGVYLVRVQTVSGTYQAKLVVK